METTGIKREDLIENIEKAKQIQLLTLANETKNDLYFLANEILDYKLMTERVHKPLTSILQSLIFPSEKYLEDIKPEPHNFSEEKARDWQIFKNELTIEDLRKKFRLILMPRGTFKSTITTISFPLQLLLLNPDIRILIDSETFDKSRAFMAEIRGHLESNEKYRTIFKAIHGIYPDEYKGKDKWGDTEINVAARRKKSKEPNLSCSGVGVTKVGMHYDVILSDDLHSEKNVTNKEQIQQVIDHYKLNLSLLEPDGICVVIGTRWDYLDLYQYIIDNESHRFCVYAQQAEKPDGSLLFPERHTKEFLTNQKMSQGSSIYSMQYQNLPIDDDTATFKYSQMKRIDEDFINGKPINWFLMLDPAISQEKTADDTAFVLAGFDMERNIYVRDVIRGKLMPSEIVDTLFYLYEKYKPKIVGIESVAFQKTLIYSVNDKMKERNWAFSIKEIKRKNNMSKESRIKGLQPYYENGRVFHLRNCQNIDELEYQLIHFPKGRNDDIIDALTDILEIGFPPDSRQRGISNEDREKRRRMLRVLSKPRSRITGY